MPDRSLRLTLPTGAVLPREGRPTPPSPPSKESDEPRDSNPFAPPAEDAPDRPWQPRRPEGSDSDSGSGSDSGQGGSSPWGGQWSDRQPGRAQGGRFGDRPGNNGGNGGPEGQNGGQSPGPGGMRWDPTDPAQRRARFALLSGMWGFFFALFSWPYVALLLGVLALYWGVSALRMKSRPAAPDALAPATARPAGTAGSEAARPQTTAAISGLVTGALALAMVASLFTAKLVYSDYYECRADALTNAAQKSCEDLLPKELRPLLGER
ncbi:hypothetical protein [Streptomyces sp. NPDC051684]|uniref:hypothetical protein n=1 Tax=Streptomyces sp. NPDC051684 TaxID=3365670 RepID=UPI0037A2A91F